MILSLASSLAIIYRPVGLSLNAAVLSVAIIWVGSLPGFWYFSKPAENREPCPLMAMCGLFYAVFFGLAGFIAHLLIGTGDAGPHDPRIAFYSESYISTISVVAQNVVLVGISVLFCVWGGF